LESYIKDPICGLVTHIFGFTEKKDNLSDITPLQPTEKQEKFSSFFFFLFCRFLIYSPVFLGRMKKGHVLLVINT